MPSNTRSSLTQFLHPRNLDFLGSEFQLKYTKNGRYQTKLGGLISVFVLLFMTVVTYTTLKDFMSTKAPAATISTVYSPDAPYFDLYNEEIFFHFAFRDKGRLEMVSRDTSTVERFITIKGFIQKDQIDKQTGLTKSEYTLSLNYKPCRLVQDRKAVDFFQWHKETAALIHQFGLCPELEGAQDEYFVNSKMTDPPSYQLRLFVFPCSLPNSDDCASLSEFKGLELIQSNTKKAFDASNFKEPLRSQLAMDGIHQLDPRQSKLMYYKMKNTEVWDDTWDFFFDARLRANSSDYFLDYRDSRIRDHNQLHCNASILNMPYQTQCEPYFTFNLASSGEKRIIIRTYNKFFMSLGEVGGTAEIMTIFALLIYYKYNSFFLERFVHKKFFNIESVQRLPKILFGSNKEANPDKKGIEENGLISKEVQVKSALKSAVGRTYAEREKMARREKSRKIKKTKELLSQHIDEGLDGISLFKRLDELKILGKIFFKSHHKTLLPVVLLNLMNEENERKRVLEKIREKNSVMAKERILKYKEDNLSLEQAFSKLTTTRSKNEIERLIDEFIIKSLPSYFKGSVESVEGVGSRALAKKPEKKPPLDLGEIGSVKAPEESPRSPMSAMSIRRGYSSKMKPRSSRFFKMMKVSKNREKELEMKLKIITNSPKQRDYPPDDDRI